jgi:L-ascorbate metabolism protein UlaG (beta-lactamase superfamily)
MDKVYLRPNVQVEPVIDKWYAWPHLIPPATAARNLTHRHARIMESYISNPDIHANAVRNPKMLGGPFMDYSSRKDHEIKALLTQTLTDRAYLLDLSVSLEYLDRMLQSEAKGGPLLALYARIPETLKGYVELFYDLNNHPGYRLIESLLYRSEKYRTDGQEIVLSQINGDARPFILSTPRLPASGLLHLKLPFHHESVDYLFATKRTPQSFGELVERCGVSYENRDLFRSFFTSEKPRSYSPYQGSGARWRYFGHACILLETQALSVLFDPVLSYTYESEISRYTYDDLPDKIDYVLITHNHQDHVLFETMLQLRHKIGCVVVPRNGNGSLEDPSLKLTLQNIGFRNVVELEEMDTLELGPASVTGIPFLGEHSDLNVRTKLAYLLNFGGQRLLFAADSCNIQPILYMHLHHEIGDVRALFVGMECDGAPLSWLYGPLLTRQLERAQDQSRRLSGSNFSEALDIVERLNCKEVFVYAMGQEPWLTHVMSIKYTSNSNPIVQSNRLLDVCRKRGMLAERLFGEREMLLV